VSKSASWVKIVSFISNTKVLVFVGFKDSN